MTWYQSMGPQRPVLRPRSIGSRRARTQILFYSSPKSGAYQFLLKSGLCVELYTRVHNIFSVKYIRGWANYFQHVGIFCCGRLHRWLGMMPCAWHLAQHCGAGSTLTVPSGLEFRPENLSILLFVCRKEESEECFVFLWAENVHRGLTM
jgi:hypothetical protein